MEYCRQQAFDNLGDDLCQKNADMIKSKLIKLEEDINETLTEIRYEMMDISSPAQLISNIPFF